jgi:hypothetical protein
MEQEGLPAGWTRSCTSRRVRPVARAPDAGCGLEQRHVGAVGAERSQVALELADLLVQRLDQDEARAQRAVPGLGQRQALEQEVSFRGEQVAGGAAEPMGDQRLVDPVFEHRAVLDQVEAKARPLALATHARVGQPHLGHQLAPSKLGQHLRVDPVGLARQRRQRPRSLRVGDAHIPAGKLELIVHEARAVHRLDHSDDVNIAQSMHQPREPILGSRLRDVRSLGEALPHHTQNSIASI